MSFLLARPSHISDKDDGFLRAEEKYFHEKELLYQMLGINTEEGQRWVAGFGNIYTHSIVYPTCLEGIALRAWPGDARYGENHKLCLETEKPSVAVTSPDIKQTA